MKENSSSTLARSSEANPVRDGFIDMTGDKTGVPVSRRLVISLVVAAALFLALSQLPLQAYGENTALALGFLVASIFIMVFLPVNIAVCGLIIAVGGALLGFWDYGAIGANFGKSSFLSIFGMLIVSMGCEFTPFGKRLAYTLLYRFGQNPRRLVLVLGVASAVLSSFVSNVAVIIMMSGVCAELLSVMGEKPGKSSIGRAVMLIIPMAAIVGGAALINGSPTGNTMAITFLENASDGVYTVTYSQWALFGVSTVLLTIVPMCLIYIKCCGMEKRYENMPSREYYGEMLAELGKINGSEIRWLLTVAAMVCCMLNGVSTGLAALGFACISVLPGVGTVPADKAIKKLPLHVMVASGFVPLLATLMTGTGLGDCITDLIVPLVDGLGPLALSIASALIMGIMVNAFVNANMAVLALIMGVMTPTCIGLGYNPSVILMPTMFLASFFFVMGAHNIMLLNKGYGYWEMKETMLPGIIVVIMCAIIFPVICYFVAQLVGISIFI